jgi:hypothetical protein
MILHRKDAQAAKRIAFARQTVNYRASYAHFV